MAVKVQNEANIRKAKRWNEKDDAALLELLRKKVKEVDLAIKESPSPFMRSKLKAKKAQYKSMANKVANGTYNGDIIFSEMQAAAALRTQDLLKQQKFSNPKEAKKYINSYQDMDFDYERYFRKTRYFGKSLPIILTILTLVLLASFLLGAFLPTSLKNTIYDSTGFTVDTVFSFKLGPDEKDFTMVNNGSWPDGTWKYVNDVEQRLTPGEPYVNPTTGTKPEHVSLYTDLGMRTVNITYFDIIKAWFQTKMLKKVRLDFLEDRAPFQGPSWFYAKYMDKAEADIANLRNPDGSINWPVLIKYLSGYGTIMLLIITFLLAFYCLIVNICRIFSYTSRRVHTANILLLVLSVLIVILPFFMGMEGFSGQAISTALKNYFNYAEFFVKPEITLSMNLFAFVPAIISLLLIIIPKFFKNRLKKRPTFVPRGNRPRIEKEQQMKQVAYNNVKRSYQNNSYKR